MIEIIKVDSRRYVYLYDSASYTHKNFWYGRLAKEFKIDIREVEINDFFCLTNGINPLSDNYFNNSAEKHFAGALEMIVLKPKGMSILHHCGLIWEPQLSQKLEKIDELALKSVLEFIQNEHSSIRIRLEKKGKRKYVKTLKILVANFSHLFTANQQDPHWHWHCVVMPFTVYNNKVYALQNNLQIRSPLLYGAMYRCQQLKLLHKNGIKTIITDEKNAFFEIARIPKEILRIFSTRSEEIKEYKEEFKRVYPHADEYTITNLSKFKNRQKHNENDVHQLIRKNVERIQKAGFTQNMFFNIFSEKIDVQPLDISFIVHSIYEKFGDTIFKKSKEWLLREIAITSIRLGVGANVSEIIDPFQKENHIEVARKFIEMQNKKIIKGELDALGKQNQEVRTADQESHQDKLGTIGSTKPVNDFIFEDDLTEESNNDSLSLKI